jgi:hypothetical protein
MGALVGQLLEVCALRRGPQDLPYSPPATATAIVALLAFQAGAALYGDAPGGAIAGRLAVTLVLLVGVTTLLLRARGVDNRRIQTLLAQAGTGLLFSLAMLPLALALRPYVGVDTTPPTTAMLPALAALVLFVWKLRVDAAIWASALDLPRPRALLLAVLLVVAELVLLRLLAPVSLAAAS